MASRAVILEVLRAHPLSTSAELVEAMGFERGTAEYVREYENVRKKLPKMRSWGEVEAVDLHIPSIPVRWYCTGDLPPP